MQLARKKKVKLKKSRKSKLKTNFDISFNGSIAHRASERETINYSNVQTNRDHDNLLTYEFGVDDG